jgi:hypothetical protein
MLHDAPKMATGQRRVTYIRVSRLLKNGAKQKSHFLLCELKKTTDGLFQQPISRVFVIPSPGVDAT